MALRAIEFCAGVGMLGEGLRAGLAYMGRAVRTVCYVEREAGAAAVVVARIKEKRLDSAPIWSDLLTFDARAWSGAVDIVLAGFPCQDLSLAGRRAGLDGERSGLFFDILDRAHECGARELFLENVAGIATATAAVVDEEEGALEERAAARVLGELADRGWHAEWLTISAADVGASHGRERWFCYAWRELDDADGSRGIGRAGEAGTAEHFAGVADTSEPGLPDTERRELSGSERIDEGRTVGELRGPLLFAPGPSDARWPDIIDGWPWLAPALAPEPVFRGMADGLAGGLDFDGRARRLKCGGNGVVALCAAVAFVVLSRRRAEG